MQGSLFTGIFPMEGVNQAKKYRTEQILSNRTWEKKNDNNPEMRYRQ